MLPHDPIVKLNDKAVGMFFGWPTEEDSETPTFSTYVNATRDSRDDMLEHIQHNKSDCLGELEKGFNKMAEIISVLVNTRNSANPNDA